ncbi:ATP-grasp domain-containing protein [Micromonospora echinofusca]|uniref:ATP-grasp domain-containing protein n=2 Tax=Micromonospora echinofusca TaxID=47858 RepID=A0ABS3W1F5_MICEH|nr:ATP-grasp domain-containing protein [Micromonospora echinofusca]
MRARFVSLVDHIQAMLDLAIDIHVVTVDSEPVGQDPRFASVRQLPVDTSHEQFVETCVQVAQERGASAVFTFLEIDIEIAEAANARLGNKWGSVAAARICRDKMRQRMFLREHGIPSVWFHPVGDIEAAVTAAKEQGFPLIVKPTRAAASEYVELVHDETRLRAALAGIQDMIARKRGFYYDSEADNWALLEEYLPGQEVTLDGVVLDGRFVLGGVHNKRESSGPFFEEDFYTLPFSNPEREDELVGIATQIVDHLDIQLCLFNAELREGADGRYRLVEFSIRGSGGHPYRHIKDVYSIDLVRMYLRAACGEPVEEILAQENQRSEPRMTVCAKVVYANGLVVRNSVGEAIHSPYFRVYFPVARPGTNVVADERGIEFTGLLSVWMPWEPGQDPARVHRVAEELAGKLDVEIVSDTPEARVG